MHITSIYYNLIWKLYAVNNTTFIYIGPLCEIMEEWMFLYILKSIICLGKFNEHDTKIKPKWIDLSVHIELLKEMVILLLFTLCYLFIVFHLFIY